jgi:polysaccharide pyruvyl transferase WcaK-like protein
MNRVTLLDTSFASKNHGDGIIMEAVERELAPIFPNSFFSSVATHEWMFGRSHELIRDAQYTIAGGSNLIGSRLWWPGQLANWKVGPHDIFSVKDVILMGVGWGDYEKNPGVYTRWLLRSLLSDTAKHSVRDGYTKAKFESIGIKNVINTGCPTLWALTPEHCAEVPTGKASQVLCTLNTNRPDPDLDRKLIQTLRQHYEKVWMWIQTYTDYAYCQSLGEEIEYAGANLSGLHAALEIDDLDYVGNRLHAGIRALQKKRRTIILAIDNRAKEMGADFDLPTIGRTDFEGLSAMIESNFETRIPLPTDRIEQWKSQFS